MMEIKTGIDRFFWMAKYTEKQEPGFLLTAFIGKVADTIRILLPLYLSRLVPEAVFSGEKPKEVFFRVFAVVLSYFILSIISGYFQRKATFRYQRFLKKHQVNKALTILDMDYESTDRDDVQNELVALKQMEKTVAMGIRTFQEGFSAIFGYSLCILFEIFLIRDIFFTPAEISFFMNLGLTFGYLGIIVLLHYFAAKVDLKMMKEYGDTIKDIYVKHHRYLEQYSELLFDYKTGKDIRFYSEALGKRYNDVYRLRSSETYNAYARVFSVAGVKRDFLSGVITILTALFVGMKTLLGCIELVDVFLCIGVLTLLFKNIEDLISYFGKILSSDGIRKKFIQLFMEKKVSITAQEEESVSSDGESEAPVFSSDFVFEKNCEYDGDDGCSFAKMPIVEFRNVGFKYPNSEIMVLQDINLKIFDHQKMALVGRNGSGKTTLIKLLLGLYAPTTGKILIWGEDTVNWEKERFSRFFSAVFQDFKLFSFKIGENVAGEEMFEEKLVEACLKKVGLSEFYEKHGSDGFLYRDFEEGGIEISGGEAQKIAMARAIYHGGEFFILDEPTAALDPLSEYEIYTHFGEITSEHPAVYISHRLSSCIFCDAIAVMENGHIVQTGSHETLIKEEQGMYAKLWNAQARHYKD